MKEQYDNMSSLDSYTAFCDTHHCEDNEEQAAKAAMGTECPESQAAAAKKRKERQLARAPEGINATPAQTAAEAAYRTLSKKRLSSKINFDVLEDMFETSAFPSNVP
ncbi:hypothetical protein ACLB2K_047032 [Fragaria x ananassa]